LGHEQTSRHVRIMSVIPLKTDIHQRDLHVRKVPLSDIFLARIRFEKRGPAARKKERRG
jgi:hypothetical protein